MYWNRDNSLSLPVALSLTYEQGTSSHDKWHNQRQSRPCSNTRTNGVPLDVGRGTLPSTTMVSTLGTLGFGTLGSTRLWCLAWLLCLGLFRTFGEWCRSATPGGISITVNWRVGLVDNISWCGWWWIIGWLVLFHVRFIIMSIATPSVRLVQCWVVGWIECGWFGGREGGFVGSRRDGRWASG